ncbi:hypothetical protein DO021_05600, partial [Desulfobacter hydrogenophilus]
MGGIGSHPYEIAADSSIFKQALNMDIRINLENGERTVAAILIVDDDPIFCTPFTAYLKKLGHQCQTAQTFSQGAALARDVDFDVVFLDVLLPDANGLECINYFINASSSPELIIITGKSELSGAEMALENGAWDYLEKPPAYDDVKLTLKRALQFRDNKMVSP